MSWRREAMRPGFHLMFGGREANWGPELADMMRSW